MSLLNRDAILSMSVEPKREIVHVPEWGGDVIVRGLTAVERDEYESSIVSFKNGVRRTNMSNARAKLVRYGVINEDGTNVFEAADVDTLGRMPSGVIEKLASKIQDLSAMNEDGSEVTEGN